MNFALLIFFFIMGFAILFPNIVQANETPETSSPKKCTSFLSDNFKFFGYAQGSYNYLLRSNKFISGIQDRIYDLKENGLTLQEIYLNLSTTPGEGFGGLLNVLLGRDALTSYSYGFNPRTGIQDFGWDVQLAYLEYVKGPFTIRAGKFDSLAGTESTNQLLTTNFSYSILSGYAIPALVTGLRAIFEESKKFTFILGVSNGWDTIRDTSAREKTLELGISSIPNSFFSFSIQRYSGQERSNPLLSSGPIGRRGLVDVIATFNLTPKLTLMGNYDYGTQTNVDISEFIVSPSEANSLVSSSLENSAELSPHLISEETVASESSVDSSEEILRERVVWQGIAGYINYKFNDKWRISFRVEDFNDKEGYRTGVPQNWKEATFTVGYFVNKNLELRAETRHDLSNVNSFLDKNGVTTSNNQQSYALMGIFSF